MLLCMKFCCVGVLNVWLEVISEWSIVLVVGFMLIVNILFVCMNVSVCCVFFLLFCMLFGKCIVMKCVL